MPSPHQPVKDQKDAVTEKLKLKERFQKLDKECEDKEQTLRKEELMRQEVYEKNRKKAIEEHEARMLKMKEQNDLHLEDTRRRMTENQAKRASLKDALTARLQDLDQACSIAAAAEAGREGPRPAAIPLQEVMEQTEPLQMQQLTRVVTSTQLTKEMLMRTFTEQALSDVQAAALSGAVLNLMNAVAVDANVSAPMLAAALVPTGGGSTNGGGVDAVEVPDEGGLGGGDDERRRKRDEEEQLQVDAMNAIAPLQAADPFAPTGGRIKSQRTKP